MASGVLFLEGFDHGPTGSNQNMADRWTSGSLNWVDGPYARSGGQGGFIIGSGNEPKRYLGASYDHLVVGHARKLDADPTSYHMVRFWADNGTTEQFSIYMNAVGQIEARRGATILGTSAVRRLRRNVWHYIECRVKFDDSVGVVEVVVDGEQVINLTSQDTQNQATADCDAFSITGNVNTSIDDVVCYDYAVAGALWGDVRVVTLFPDGAGNSTQWTPSAGSNYATVDEIDDWNDDTDYVESSTVTNKDLYTLTNHGITAGTVKALCVNSRHRKTDGATRQIRHVIRHSTNETNGATLPNLTSSYTNERTFFDDVPGGTGWTLTQVDAMEAGMEVIA